VHLVCFIIRIYHDARSPERQIPFLVAYPSTPCRSMCVFGTASFSVFRTAEHGLDLLISVHAATAVIKQCDTHRRN